MESSDARKAERKGGEADKRERRGRKERRQGVRAGESGGIKGIDVFVGKSTILKLKDDSGQNPIDAAKLGCKIYHGPYVYNFHDIYKLLQKKNVAKMIKNPLELSKYLIIDFKEQRNKKNKYKPSLENLEKKIFKDTMKSLDNYLFNEIL